MTGNRTLEVRCQGEEVGILAEMPDRRIAFQYSSGWLKNGFSISPLSLPLRDEVFIPPEKSRDYFGGLFGVFADSLPDSWGDLLLDRYLQTIGVPRGDLTTLDRLAYVGRSGMGALEYHPSNETDFDIKAAELSYDKVAEECGKLLDSKTSDQLDMLFKLGGSIGGTRPKIFLSENGREWIIKFPAKRDPSICGKREYDYSICAKECGIVMTDTELVPSSICEGYFKTARFDRSSGGKIFTATFAGLLEADFRAPSCDYATFMKMIRAFTKDNGFDKMQMFRIMCFNVMTHNRDDHSKNFSFLHTDAGWRLSPAYDLTYSDTYWGEQTTSVNGKGKNIAEEDFVRIGLDAGLSKTFCEQCVQEIRLKTKALEQYTGRRKPGEGRRGTFQDYVSELNGD